MSGLRHALTVLAVDEVGPHVAFYEAVLAWPVTVREAVYVELQAPDGQRLGIYQREGFGQNTGQAPVATPFGELAGVELYLLADDSDAVNAAIGRLRASGARELAALAPRPWGDEAAYFADPSGNVIVIARPLEPEA